MEDPKPQTTDRARARADVDSAVQFLRRSLIEVAASTTARVARADAAMAEAVRQFAALEPGSDSDSGPGAGLCPDAEPREDDSGAGASDVARALAAVARADADIAAADAGIAAAEQEFEALGSGSDSGSGGDSGGDSGRGRDGDGLAAARRRIWGRWRGLQAAREAAVGRRRRRRAAARRQVWEAWRRARAGRERALLSEQQRAEKILRTARNLGHPLGEG